MDAEKFVQALGFISTGLLLVGGGIFGLIHAFKRIGFITDRMRRDDSVDTSSTESALQMLKETRAELERAYAAQRMAEENANSGMQREISLTRRCAVAEGNVERLRRTLETVRRGQKDLIDAGQLEDPLVDRLTEIIVDTSGNQ